MKIRVIHNQAFRDQIKRRWSHKLMILGGSVSAGWVAVTSLPMLADHLPRWLPPACAAIIFFTAAAVSYLKQSDLPTLPGDPDNAPNK